MCSIHLTAGYNASFQPDQNLASELLFFLEAPQHLPSGKNVIKFKATTLGDSSLPYFFQMDRDVQIYIYACATKHRNKCCTLWGDKVVKIDVLPILC